MFLAFKKVGKYFASRPMCGLREDSTRVLRGNVISKNFACLIYLRRGIRSGHFKNCFFSKQ